VKGVKGVGIGVAGDQFFDSAPAQPAPGPRPDRPPPGQGPGLGRQGPGRPNMYKNNSIFKKY